MRRIALLVAVLAPAMLPVLTARAGTPVTETITCPVGGERFDITSTLSCSGMRRTMSFRQITSCDWIDRLPVCPGNGLPVYREFEDGDLARLKAIVSGPGYSDLRALPPWRRAYALAELMQDAPGQTGLELMLATLWFAPKDFSADPQAITDLSHETSVALDGAPAVEQALLHTILAYALGMVGQTGEARTQINLARSHAAPPYVTAYVNAVEACLADMQAPDCAPDAPFNPD